MVEGWVYKPHADASEALTTRIFDGVLESPFTPRFIKSYVQGL